MLKQWDNHAWNLKLSLLMCPLCPWPGSLGAGGNFWSTGVLFFLPLWSKFRLKFPLSQSCSWASLQGAGSSHSQFCNFCCIFKIFFIFTHGMDGLSLTKWLSKHQCTHEGFSLCWFHTSHFLRLPQRFLGLRRFVVITFECSHEELRPHAEQGQLHLRRC